MIIYSNGSRIWLNADGIESAYTWNKENMLVNVVYKGTPATDAEFTYNAFNQKVLESVSSAPEDLVLAWDGGQYLGSTPVGTDLKTARLNVDGVAIAELVDSDIRVDYLVDALGSVTGVTNASGSVKRDARYSPYGTLLSGNQFEWGWTGNSGSRHTGVPYAEQYNWNRHYSSRTKQWISRDILWPIELPYGYVLGNPVMNRDETGQFTKKEGPCKSTVVTPSSGDRVGIAAGKNSTLIQGGEAIKMFMKEGEDCIAINGGFFGDLNGGRYEVGDPAQPIEDVVDCHGGTHPGRHVPIPALPVRTRKGRIHGRPPSKPLNANAGKVKRTGACTDKNGNLLFVAVIPNVDFNGFEVCMSKMCKKPNVIVLLDGGGSSQIVEKPEHKTGRPVHNWIVICS